MSNLENKEKKRRALLEGFNNVPKLLEEARRAVDEVTQAVQDKGGGEETPAVPEGQKGGGAGPKRQKAAHREKSATERGRQKTPSRPPASREQPVPPAASALGISGSPQPGLAYFGITVKHAIPGRIRLRLRQMLHNEALAEKLTSLLAAVPGIASVEASIATGSLLITFSPRDLATVKSRNNLAGVMHRVYPGLDTESLLKRMLGA